VPVEKYLLQRRKIKQDLLENMEVRQGGGTHGERTHGSGITFLFFNKSYVTNGEPGADA
jgi:hypothetical protein